MKASKVDMNRIKEVELLVKGTMEEINKVMEFLYENDIEVETGSIGNSEIACSKADVCSVCKYAVPIPFALGASTLCCSKQDNRRINGFESCLGFAPYK